jgi:hypothetical protein
MLGVLCLCILASQKLPPIDLEPKNPSFLRWFYHNYAYDEEHLAHIRTIVVSWVAS